MTRGMWVRWSLRDLRARWLQVVVIALIVAIGSGAYAGLGSTAVWRRLSNDASYASVRMHDIRVSLNRGSSVHKGDLGSIVRRLGSAVVAAEERLVVPIQVDASTDDETILVPGRVIGTDITHPATVDGFQVTAGRGLDPADASSNEVVLEEKFAAHYDLPPRGTIRVGGGLTLNYVGRALHPEYFMVITESGGMMAEANFAVLFAPLELAQNLGGQPGRVNDVVVRLREGADVGRVREELATLLDEALPGIGATLQTAQEDPAYRILYDDIENDQRFWNVIAFSILFGAALAAFNLAGRVVEAQRREIGMGMAMGVSPWRLAVRPLLFGLEISLLGVVFGVGVGILVGGGLRSMLESFFPLPVWQTPFQTGKFVQAALLGITLPFVATALPVWRAVRVPPVEALSTQHRAARGGLVPLLSRLPIPGSSLTLMPLRNVGRSPRRTFLTALGIGASMMALVATLGLLDSFMRTIDKGEDELLKGNPDRMTVLLGEPVPADSPDIRGIVQASSVADSDVGLSVPAVVRAGRTDIDVTLELIDFDKAMWTPTLTRSSGEVEEGIVLSEEAAKDLQVDVGDSVEVEHPTRTGPTSFDTAVTSIPVSAVHPDPIRIDAYADANLARPMGLEGLANVVQIDPLGSEEAVKRELFGSPSVVSVQSVASMSRIFRDLVDEFVDVLRFMQIFVLALAILIAFNAASINFDERVRENATIFAFGVGVRRVLGMGMIEGLLVGFLGTVLGIAAGMGVVQYVVQVLAEDTMPEYGLSTYLSLGTAGATALMGVAAVAIAPVLTVRKLRRMDVPSALRVIE